MDPRKFQDVLHESSELAFEHFGLVRLCESPIERLFATAFWSRFDWRGVSEMSHVGMDGLAEYAAEQEPKVVWSPQVLIAGHRVDFLFAQEMAGSEPTRFLVVECDGHEFHEKTKKQAARDKARDRAIVAAGASVIRFAGSEIYRDAGACADEVFGIIHGEWVDSLHRAHVLREEVDA